MLLLLALHLVAASQQLHDVQVALVEQRGLLVHVLQHLGALIVRSRGIQSRGLVNIVLQLDVQNPIL
jgi:hypothetical protein